MPLTRSRWTPIHSSILGFTRSHLDADTQTTRITPTILGRGRAAPPCH